jgi:hypothetical protein
METGVDSLGNYSVMYHKVIMKFIFRMPILLMARNCIAIHKEASKIFCEVWREVSYSKNDY